MMRFLLGVSVCAAVSVSACGGMIADRGESGSAPLAVGAVEQSDARVAVVDNTNNEPTRPAIVYVCGGEQTVQTHTRWFAVTIADDELFGEKDGWQISASYQDHHWVGTLKTPSGNDQSWQAFDVEPGSNKGLYRAQVADGVVGAIVLADDNSEQIVGAWRKGNNVLQVTPVMPVHIERGGFDVSVPLTQQSTILRVESKLVATMAQFVGRQKELAKLENWYIDSHRLVTIWGSAGVGKTRLAQQFVSVCQGPWRKVFWCSVADARDDQELLATIADVIGQQGRSEDAILRWLDRSESLLVLDNLEQIKHVSHLTNSLLTRANSLRILATSQAKLNLSFEQVLELGPLPVSNSPQTIGHPEAVQLLSHWLSATRSGLTPTAEEIIVLGQIAEKLEGIPLALELAAARLGVLGVHGLYKRLQQGLDLLSTPTTRVNQSAGVRHSTLRHAIAWSVGLLSEEEKQVLTQCTVFRGGFTADAADAICKPSKGSTLDLLDVLRLRSLLHSDWSHQEVRLSLLESVRAFASQSVGELEQRALEDAHAQYFETMLRRFHSGRESSGFHLKSIQVERDNIVAAIERGFRDSRAVLRSISLIVLADLILSAGAVTRHLLLLEQAINYCVALLSKNCSPDELGLFAKLRACYSKALALCGKDEQAVNETSKAIELAHRSENKTILADIFIERGVRLQARRALIEAENAYREGLELYTELQHLWGQARALGNLGTIFHDRGQFDEAQRLYEMAVGKFRQTGDSRLEGIFRTNLGVLAHERHRVADAHDHYTAALAQLESTGDERYIAITLANLGALEHEQGAFEQACVFHERALSFFERIGDTRSEAYGRGRFAASLAALFQLEKAQNQIELATRLVAPDDLIACSTLSLYRACVDVIRARRAQSVGESLLEQSLLQRAQLALENARQTEQGNPSTVDVSDDARTACRWLEKLLGGDSGVRSNTQRSTLILGPEAMWYRDPSGQLHDLRAKRVLRAIVSALVDEKLSPALTGLSVGQLRQAAWPGERMTDSSAANRVHVAMAELRKLGLKDALLTVGTCYRLDPALVVQRTGAGWAELPDNIQSAAAGPPRRKSRKVTRDN